ncbi:MAG: hypothetical protein ACM3KR_00700, partial [Deltaproteobacteria bacterium]
MPYDKYDEERKKLGLTPIYAETLPNKINNSTIYDKYDAERASLGISTIQPDYKPVKKPSQNVGASSVKPVTLTPKITVEQKITNMKSQGKPESEIKSYIDVLGADNEYKDRLYKYANIGFMNKFNKFGTDLDRASLNTLKNMGNFILDSKGGSYDPATGFRENKETNREKLGNTVKAVASAPIPFTKANVGDATGGALKKLNQVDQAYRGMASVVPEVSDVPKIFTDSNTRAEMAKRAKEGWEGTRHTEFSETMGKGWREATKKYTNIMAPLNFAGSLLSDPSNAILAGAGGVIAKGAKAVINPIRNASKELNALLDDGFLQGVGDVGNGVSNVKQINPKTGNFAKPIPKSLVPEQGANIMPAISEFVSSQTGKKYTIPDIKDVKHSVDSNGVVHYSDNIFDNVDIKDQRDFAKQYAIKNYVTNFDNKGKIIGQEKPIIIKDDGLELLITKTGINDVSKKFRASEQQSLANSLVSLPQIIENAKFIKEVPDLKGNNLAKWRNYESSFKDSAGLHKVNIQIKQVPIGNRYYYHALEKIEIDSPHVPYDVKPLQTLPQESISNNIIRNPAENINKVNTNIPNALPEVATTAQKIIHQKETGLAMPVKDTSGFNAYTNDIDRIFKKVYGKNYEEAKAKYLTPLNGSKKNNQLMQQEILTGLKNDIVNK